MQTKHLPVAEVGLPFERDVFVRTLLRHLAGTLEDVIGLDQASGFVAVVGQRIGDEIDAMYRSALQVDRLTRPQVAEVLVDLKRRIQGDFYVIEESDDKIVLGNRRCPFGEKVANRPSLCMMTSNMFGAIAAENLGYAKVAIEESFALGHTGCRVVLYLRPTPETTADVDGREYFRR